jgi:hypothetical protein
MTSVSAPLFKVTVEAADIRWAAKLLHQHSQEEQPQVRADALHASWQQLSRAAEKGPSQLEFTKEQILFSSKVLDDCAQQTNDSAIAVACVRVSAAMTGAL